MPHLSIRDYEALLAALRELYACQSMTEYPATALAVCSRLIQGNMSAYTEIDSKNGHPIAVFDSSESTRAAQAVLDGWQRHFHDHPILRYHEAYSSPDVRSISDFLPQRRWKNEPLYNEFYRSLGALDQLVIPAPKRGELVIGIAINRDHTAFSRRDRMVGSLLREHLLQVHSNLKALEHYRQRLLDIEEWYSRGGTAVVVINDDGRIFYCSQPAAVILRQYFTWRSESPDVLPSPLRRWAQWQIRLFRRREPSFAVPQPLTIQTDVATLTVRILPDRDPNRFVLLANELTNLSEPKALCRLGLTKREAEVLFCVAQGKTNAETATTLAISARTVQKHLERIFDKLGVSSRTEAALLALEQLRSV